MGASESKLALKKNIFELARREDIPHTDPVWQALYTLPESVDDVFQLWSPNDIKHLTQSVPPRRYTAHSQVSPAKNFETLIYVVVARLQTLQTTQVLADDQQTKNKEILNCMRILTRVMPFAFDAPHLHQWLDRFLWLPRRPTFIRDHERPSRRHKFFDGLDPTIEYREEDLRTDIGPPLADTILDLMVRYCFFPGFTIPKRQDGDGNPTLDTAIRVWTSGIGNSRPQGSTKENERNQQETSRLLICLMSQVMYTNPWDIAAKDIKPLTYMTTKLPQRAVNGLLCSLLNTVLKYNPSMWSTPAEVVVRAHENRKVLVTNCLQLILVLTIYEPPPDTIQNQFRRALSQLHRPNDFQFIQAGVNSALTYPISSTVNAYSFSKEKAIPWAPELISFLWEFVQCNKRFRRYLIDTHRMLDYVIILLYHAIDSKDDPSKQGVLRMCIYVLQTLSTEDKFAQHLNTWFKRAETLPTSLRIANFHGTYVDFLICTFHSIFMNAKGGLEPRFESLYPALLAILKNIAGRAKHLQRVTSTKLMDICAKFIAPGYMLRNDANNRQLLELMEVLRAIIENHAAENRRFIEVLVANKKRLKSIQEINIDGALAELDRLAQQRKDRGEDALSLHSPLSGSRPASFDSVRGPPPAANARPSSLGDVPENDRFAIGDEDEDDDDGGVSEDDEETPQASSTTTTLEGASSPRLSEKARGKQPATTVSIASASSRTPSTTSIPSLQSTQNNNNNNLTQSTNTLSETTPAFRPTQDWLDTWLPRLQSQVHTLLQIIELAENKQIHYIEQPPPSRINGDFPGSAAQEKGSGEFGGGEARQSAQFARQFGGAAEGAQTPRADGESPFKTPGPETPLPTPIAPDATPSAPKEAFQWTPIAIGWYTALIWSRIYLSEAEAYQGAGGIYSSTNILLFKRSVTEQEISLRSPKGAIDAVWNAVAQRISSIGLK